MIVNRRVITISVTYIVLIAAGIFFGVKPLLAQVRAKQASLQLEYDRYHNAQAKLNQLNALTQYKSEIDNAKSLIDTAIPTTLEQDKLILSLEQMVKDQNLKLTTLSPTVSAPTTTPVATANSAAAKSTKPTTTTSKSATVSNKLSAIQVTMDVSGSYADVNSLLNQIEKVNRIMTITAVTIAAAAGATTDTVTATIALTAYGRSDKL